MNIKTVIYILCAAVISPFCQGATTQAEPVVVEIRPVHITLDVGEAITVVQKGGVINSDTVQRTVTSLKDNSPGLNIVQDHYLASELSFWLDNPTQETLATYLDRPDISQKLESYRLKYMVVIEHYWWGMEAQLWNLQNRKLEGVINAKALMSTSTLSCSKNPGTWIAGTVLASIYLLENLALVSMINNSYVRVNNFDYAKDADLEYGDPYLKISETLVQNGPNVARVSPIPCETYNTLSSNPEIDTRQMGEYLAGKFNLAPAVAGN